MTNFIKWNGLSEDGEDGNKKWKNADSKIFMQFCSQQLKRKKFYIVNLDINFICEKPKINK